MSGRYFIDTNVVVYAFDPREPRKKKIANGLLADALRQRQGLISYQVVQEFFSAMIRGRFDPPLTSADALEYLSSVLGPLLQVHFSVELCRAALHLRERYKLSWYDSLIVAAAQEARCEVLYTEDLQDGQRFGDLVVTDPFRA